jgi:hypothetical protein
MSNVNLSETAPTQFQDIGGVSLAYRHFGKEGAPPVMCFQHFTYRGRHHRLRQGARPEGDRSVRFLDRRHGRAAGGA